MNHVIRLVQKEDLIRWAKEFVDDFHMRHLWYPRYQPLTDLGLYLFFHNR